MDIKTENTKNFIQSKPYLAVALSLAIISVAVLIFILGMSVGFHKARFSFQWAENYQRNFAGPVTGPREDMFRNFGGKDFIDPHGLAGQIIKIDDSSIVIKGRDNIEKIVLVKEDTTIRRFNETVKLSDLKIDEFLTVIGAPDEQGQIEAKFIRVLPEPLTLPQK